jgi:hypothetical protein
VTIKFMENGTEVRRPGGVGEVRPIDRGNSDREPEPGGAPEPKTVKLNQGIEVPRFVDGPAPVRPAPAAPSETILADAAAPDVQAFLSLGRAVPPEGLTVRAGLDRFYHRELVLELFLKIGDPGSARSAAVAAAEDLAEEVAARVAAQTDALPEVAAANEARERVAAARKELADADAQAQQLRAEYEQALSGTDSPRALAGKVAVAEAEAVAVREWVGRLEAKAAEAARALAAATGELWRSAAAPRLAELPKKRAAVKERVRRQLEDLAAELLELEAIERRLQGGPPAPAAP